MEIKRNVCILCLRKLKPIAEVPGYQKHPAVDDCLATIADAWGVPVEGLPDSEPTADPEAFIDMRQFPFVDDVLAEFFGGHGLPRLGGQSTGRGWSNFSLFQRCPYLWAARYYPVVVQERRVLLGYEAPPLAIGTMIHVFLALYYAALRPESPYSRITPTQCYEALMAKANPEYVQEAWRVFTAYRLYYQGEEILPLAIEHDLVDPRTGESCRFDMIAFFEQAVHGRPPGTYVIEHKSTSVFSQDNLDGWANDGEILGQVALWKRLGLDKRFGELQGVIVNILGKQKEPRFHRTIVAPTSFLIDQHLEDLRQWEGLIQHACATRIFPRARANCIHRHGRCDMWEHCVTGGQGA